jgi:predicted dehydrogenase
MKSTRREFLVSSAAVALGAATAASRGRVPGSNDDLRVAVAGLNGRGRDHIAGFQKLPGVRVVALCDADRQVLARALEKSGLDADAVTCKADLRALLDRNDVDAVALATPNHWHSLGAIWACQAGKDAYVEKPVSHTVWEGHQLVAAARKHARIVQAGMQCRSNPGMRELIAWVQGGGLGAVKVARGLCYKRRDSIGRAKGPLVVPAHVDFDLWCGPAPKKPLQRQRLHYDWHWVWDTGNGDLGNQGVHQVDLARWLLGAGGLPAAVQSVGGRLGYEDDGETPNTQVVSFRYPEKPAFLFEVRGLPKAAGSKEMDKDRGASIGVVVECEGGTVIIDRYDGGRALDQGGKEMRRFAGEADHYANFVDAVRARDPRLLHAPIEDGHLSSALCHFGNLSHRAGKPTAAADVARALEADQAMAGAWGRMRDHLQRNGVDVERSPVTLGATVGADCPGQHREDRPPFVVPAIE